MVELSSHSDMKVVEKHYLEPELVAKGKNIKFE